MAVFKQLAHHIWKTTSSIALISGIGLALGLMLAVVRIVILWADIRQLAAGDAAVLILQGCFQDMAFVLALTMTALGWSVLRGPARGLRPHVLVFMTLALLILGLGGANISAIRLLGEPLTLDWVKYSDLQHSRETMNSIWPLITWRLVAGGGAAVLAFAVLSALVGVALDARREVLATLPFLSLAGLLALFAATYVKQPVTPGKLSNPVAAFVQSVFSPGLDASSFSQHANDPASSVVALVGTVPPSTRPDVPAGQIRNVIFYAMESTPAKLTEGFGGTYPIMPNLVRYAAVGRKFTNVYAHAPASNYFLVSAIAGIVPELSADSMTYSHPDLQLDTIGDVLTGQGYRAGFFNSADNHFQNTAAFMTAAKFDPVLDYTDWPCASPIYGTAYDSGADVITANDLCTIKPLTDWIDADPTRPFVAMVRTGMTHYPYFPGENPATYAENADLNRYLNAARVGDQAFGQMMDHLAATGLLDTTLVVVVGDHGEAFGEHGNVGHASAIYEENIHVPLVLINPVLFAGDSSDVLAGISDLSPTILDLLGLQAPASWQGRSLFAEGRPDAVLFFAPWNGFQVGFRQGTRKYIYNAQSDESWMFDLKTDPDERTNLVATDPAAAAQARRIMAALVNDQLAQTARLLQGSVPDTTPQTSPEGGLDLYATGTMFRTAPQVQISIDGTSIGQISVAAALSNADTAVADEALDQTVAVYRLPLGPHECAKRIEVTFLNDEWEGENQTGDTDLYVQRLDIDGRSYWPKRYELATERAGGVKRAYFSLWRSGSFWVDLDLSPTCLSDSLSQK